MIHREEVSILPLQLSGWLAANSTAELLIKRDRGQSSVIITGTDSLPGILGPSINQQNMAHFEMVNIFVEPEIDTLITLIIWTADIPYPYLCTFQLTIND